MQNKIKRYVILSFIMMSLLRGTMKFPRASGFILIITTFDTANLNHKRGFYVMLEYNSAVATRIQLETAQCVLHVTPCRN